jgi:hypothetical protein
MDRFGFGALRPKFKPRMEEEKQDISQSRGFDWVKKRRQNCHRLQTKHQFGKIIISSSIDSLRLQAHLKVMLAYLAANQKIIKGTKAYPSRI